MCTVAGSAPSANKWRRRVRGCFHCFQYYSLTLRLTQTDPNGNTTVLAYDALNRIAQVTDPNEHSTQTAYDAVGNRLSERVGSSQRNAK